jgi:uncharacterized CHY-type Zn-finger protein
MTHWSAMQSKSGFRGDWDQSAVLCGICGKQLTIRQYLECSNQCPGCGAMFNPGCRNHYHFYFEQ